MFYGYENWQAHGHRVTIHVGECSFCNRGAGVSGREPSPNGRWIGPCASEIEVLNEVPAGVVARQCGHCMKRGMSWRRLQPKAD